MGFTTPALLDHFERNKDLARNVNGSLDVIFLGDSITEHLAGMELPSNEGLPSNISDVFDELFTTARGGFVNGLTLGVGGDRVS